MDILDRIDPHLTSEDSALREFSLYAIRSFPAFKKEWPKRLIRAALDDTNNATSYLFPLENRTLGEHELPLLLEALQTSSPQHTHFYLGILRNLPLSVKLANRESIGSLFSLEEWRFLLELSEADKSELDAMLREILEEFESDGYHEQLYLRAKQIAHRQVSQGFENPEELRSLVAEMPKNQWMNYKEIVAVYKLAMLKDFDSIPVLSTLFSNPDNFLQEELTNALVAFQSDHVVRAVEIYARSEDPIFPINTIGRTHSPLAIATLKQLYADFKDPEHRAYIIEGLAEQLAADGRPEIEHYMSQNRLPRVFDNEEMAYGYFKVMEYDHPQLERWGQVAHEEHERRLKMRSEPMDATLKRLLNTTSSKQPVVTEKVGRNDPCPCGSGKKYKKCHGK